jgi:hypothetical protein
MKPPTMPTMFLFPFVKRVGLNLSDFASSTQQRQMSTNPASRTKCNEYKSPRKVHYFKLAMEVPHPCITKEALLSFVFLYSSVAREFRRRFTF